MPFSLPRMKRRRGIRRELRKMESNKLDSSTVLLNE
jgi:hypothetical protein